MTINAVGEAERQGKELVTGETAVTASVEIDTPFATIDSVSITLKTGSAPGSGSSVFTYDVSGNTVTIYAWKVTSSADNTLIAGTSEVTVGYTIIGRRRK